MLQFLIKMDFFLFFLSENLGLDVDSKSPKKESAAFQRRNCLTKYLRYIFIILSRSFSFQELRCTFIKHVWYRYLTSK
jgi:hypothetical protein